MMTSKRKCKPQYTFPNRSNHHTHTFHAPKIKDLGVWWGRENDGLPLPLGGNVIHKRIEAGERKVVSDVLERSIRFSLDNRAEAVEHSLQYARDMGIDLADKFVGMYVNDWTLDYGDAGRESIRRFLRRGHEMGVVPSLPDLEFVE